MGEVLTSSYSAPSRRLNVISPIPAPVGLTDYRERAPRDDGACLGQHSLASFADAGSARCADRIPRSEEAEGLIPPSYGETRTSRPLLHGGSSLIFHILDLLGNKTYNC